MAQKIYFMTKDRKKDILGCGIGQSWRKLAEIGQKSKNMVFTTGNEWKNQRGIKFLRCFYRGLLSEIFFWWNLIFFAQFDD